MRRINQPTDEDLAEWTSLYYQTRSAKEVAFITGWSWTTVRKWLVQSGVKLNGRKAPKRTLDYQGIISEYKSGRPVKDIAYIHNCTCAAVYLVLKREGVACDRRRRKA